MFKGQKTGGPPDIGEKIDMPRPCQGVTAKHQQSPADKTVKKQRGRPFELGRSGNPAGRPKGSRNKLGEDFIAAIAKDWAEHGSGVLNQVRQTSPAAYLRVIASLVPQQLAITHDNDFSDMTDEQLDEHLFDSVATLIEGNGMPEAARAIRRHRKQPRLGKFTPARPMMMPLPELPTKRTNSGTDSL
jgi:hypothetical protein